jgi:hypothetical protein
MLSLGLGHLSAAIRATIARRGAQRQLEEGRFVATIKSADLLQHDGVLAVVKA